MSYRSRNYAASGDQFRGYVREVGERRTEEIVYDETEEEFAARRDAWTADNPGISIWHMRDRRRKYHYEDRGLQPYEEVRTFGPYATIGPAKAAAGTGRAVRKVTEHKRADGGHYTRTAEVHVGTVEWRLPE